ncbi:daxx-like protein [Spodoptera frugiperda]|uniref:Daxx-like protein n=1 Tax=Spodoptera frugiperda TaxID=7108 RepID=A0A9R0CVK3_SPOFR|nr:daxx-like protein [Spodoptera frugiperda]
MMASEDVIELGSSDDDTEPAPKKSRPKPDAMVCIPRYNFNDVTIKPSSTKLKVISGPGRSGSSSKNDPILKVLSATEGVTISKGKSQKVFSPKEIVTSKSSVVLKPATPLAKKKTTITRVPNMITNPFANKNKPNGIPVQTMISKSIFLPKTVKIQNAQPNKMTLFKQNPIKIANIAPAVLNNIHQQSKPINLPPSITVKRTPKPAHKPVIYMKCNRNITNTKPINVVPTVELDDDEGSASKPATPGPAWYLRPEEQEASTLEEENNKEPEGPKMIEITIDDSPIKPVTNKRAAEIGTELAITIDDSPIKAVTDKNGSLSGSEEESTIPKSPNSRKRLEYPKEEDESRKTVEIEIEIPAAEVLELNKKGVDEDGNDDITEVSVVTETSKKDDSSKVSNESGSREKTGEEPSTGVQGEFHPVYQNFIDVCFQLEDSEDMNKIVEKKIKGYYRQVPKDYTESEEFIDMVRSKVVAMKASPEKMYLFIKDVVDELNMERKRAKAQPQVVALETVPEESDKFQFGDDNEFDSKRQRQIRKLEKTIKKLHRAIQKLEEHEVDFDDEDDSVYLLTERYKERMVRVYAKFCQLTNTKMPSEPRITVESRPGQPAGPAKRLEKWVNKKVPIGTPLPFPDFHDVLRCVREANDEDKLCWNEAQIMEEARDLFTRCGKKLQRRRQENEWRLAASRLTLDVGDPAENNEQLRQQLEVNRKLASSKETEIFNKFADRQNQMKLEAEEIGDKEAEESPVESEEDEDANDDDESISLENKGKRKERLKRLIEEISKGPSEGKENQPLQEPNTSPTEETVKETEVKGDKEDSEALVKSKNTDKDIQNAETFSVSSENSKDLDLESDVDELHLLQKLRKSNEDSSTQESSDSDSLIAISDSFDSDNDSKELSDVISIENSSYSESEADKVDSVPSKNLNIQQNNKTEVQTKEVELVLEDTDMNPTNEMNVECSKSVEDNLLASSDNESGENKKPEHTLAVDIEIPCEDVDTPSTQVDTLSPSNTCINLKDDLISIDETVVGNEVANLEENPASELPVIECETENSGDKLSAAENENLKDGDSRKENRDDISTDSLQIEAPNAPEELQKDIVGSTPISPELDPPEPMDVDEPPITETVEAQSHTGRPEVAL